MMLHSGIASAYAFRADGPSRGRRTSSPLGPSSAFANPPASAAAAAAYAYGSPPRRPATKPAARSSPTSVAGAAFFPFLEHAHDAHPSPAAVPAAGTDRQDGRPRRLQPPQALLAPVIEELRADAPPVVPFLPTGRCVPAPAASGGRRGAPAPQKLRDNPEREARWKTEMCHYYERGGAASCPWGAKCNYAHGKHELRRQHTTLALMEDSGQIVNAQTHLARPCMTWVCTGACPFGRRCNGIHDPSIKAPEHPSWLPAAMAYTNAQIIVDKFARHRESAVHQENPLVAQSVWESCRPSQRGRSNGPFADRPHLRNANKSVLDLEQDWSDTYALICNACVPAFPAARPGRLSLLQRLCIAISMRGSDGPFQQGSGCSRRHRDYVFYPTHSVNFELCRVLQSRYFLLLDVDFSNAEVSLEDIVTEISFEEFDSRMIPWSFPPSPFDPSKCVAAHEVAFGPKGDAGANVSVWFDAPLVELEPSEIKRSRRLKQKQRAKIKDGHARPNADGALIARMCRADFPGGPPYEAPFVPMLPAEDTDEVHRFVLAIMELGINSLILQSCPFADKGQERELYARARELQGRFFAMALFHDKWTWPKREGMAQVTETTQAPPGNKMPYIPLKHNEKCLHIWDTFVKTMAMSKTYSDGWPASDWPRRLSIFRSLAASIPHADHGSTASLPHILGGWWNAKACNSTMEDTTWGEILLGLPEDGKWGTALRLHNEKMQGAAGNMATRGRNTPLSTTPFVQL